MRSFNALLILAVAHVGGAAPSLDAQYLKSSTSTRCHASPPTSFWQWIRSGVSKMPWIHTEGQILKPARPFSYSPSKGAPIRQGDDLVLRFNITNDVEASGLREAIDTLFLDVWEFADHWVDIRISESTIPRLLDTLPISLRHASTPIMRNADLASAIAASYPSGPTTHDSDAGQANRKSFTPQLRSGDESEGNIFFKEYRSLSVMMPWMRLLQSLFPTHVKMVSVGTSYEGRDIPALRVGVHPAGGDGQTKRRKTVIIAGGSHAREWISTSTVNYIAYSLVTAYGKRKSVTEMIDNFDWLFVPTINPDGYAYTWEVDRLWRKNRQETSLRFCRGVDLDRAWGYMWDGAAAATSSPCSESYAGEGPFEGVEARRFADWAKNETENNNVDFIGFIDLHSYSQQILYPYSYSCHEQPPTLEDLEELGEGIAKAIRLNHHERYKVAQACQGNVAVNSLSGTKNVLSRMESGGGSALDWFYHEMRVRNAFQIKLRDKGSYGFLLPKDAIIPTGAEMLQAIEYYGRTLLEARSSDHGGGHEQEQVMSARWRNSS